MHNFIDAFPKLFSKKPWLILGKGPSFSKISEFEMDRYNTLALNHAARELSVDVGHCIDIEVLRTNGEQIEKAVRFLVLPWLPHVGMKPGELTVEDYLKEIPALKKLHSEDRLLWYDLSSGGTKVKSSHKPVNVRFFSSEAVLNLLAQCGVQEVRSLGLDGGLHYAQAFLDVQRTSRLANGLPSFDLQFGEFTKIIKETGLQYGPLDCEIPVMVYVGGGPEEWLSTKILEYSIRKHSSLPVSVASIADFGISIPLPKDPKNKPRTPFSFQRFLIPQLRNHKGRAIYLDSDMLVVDDIRLLWCQSSRPDAGVLCIDPASEEQKQSIFAVMIMDCELCNWSIEDIVKQLDDGHLTYENLMYKFAIAKSVEAKIPPFWNCLDDYKPGATCLVHYTDMNKQPWLSRSNHVAHLWISYLRQAIADGFVSTLDLKQQIKLGHVRPSLLAQVEQAVDDPADLAGEAVAIDLDFVPPHQRKTNRGLLSRISSLFKSNLSL